MDKILRPTYARINLSAVRKNFKKISELFNVPIMPVVKANAYGHGAVKVAKVLQEEGAPILGVATIEEGIQLRENSVRIPILIMGSIYPLDNFEAVIKYELTPIIASKISAQVLEETAGKLNKKTRFHLKVDSGMGRIGVSPETAVCLWNKLQESEYLIGEGIFTHLARADENLRYTKEQLDRFRRVLDKIKSPPPYVHAANTAGIMNFPDSYFTLVRPGLAIFGLYPGNVERKKYKFEPVMSWYSKIVFLKEIDKGNPISYGGTWAAPRKSKIATLCVGYADGYQRILSNRSEVIIKGKRCPVVGRVCMDMIMIDVTDVEGVSLGDEALLLGKNSGEEVVSAEEIANWAETINYEITTNISYRVPRVYIDD